jgi:hypothetical protein
MCDAREHVGERGEVARALGRQTLEPRGDPPHRLGLPTPARSARFRSEESREEAHARRVARGVAIVER